MVKEIQLTQGKVALVDDADYEWLNQWKWHAEKKHGIWYAKRSLYTNGKQINIKMHSLILGTPKGMQSDHKDGDGLNNQRYNLRVCTYAENQHNRAIRIDSKSSVFKGVSHYKYGWRVSIKVNYKSINVGYFKDETEAAKAYDQAAIKYFGEFANLNFGGSNG